MIDTEKMVVIATDPRRTEAIAFSGGRDSLPAEDHEIVRTELGSESIGVRKRGIVSDHELSFPRRGIGRGDWFQPLRVDSRRP